MVMARLHIICGNCGCNDEFTFKIVPDMNDRGFGEPLEPAVCITCANCSTVHTLDDTITEDRVMGVKEKEHHTFHSHSKYTGEGEDRY